MSNKKNNQSEGEDFENHYSEKWEPIEKVVVIILLCVLVGTIGFGISLIFQ